MNVLAAPRAMAGGWLKQPPGLAILFLTQMWEIFSYYGMRTLLVYYMTKQLLFGQQHASLVYGVYVATFYFTPIVGGVIADGKNEIVRTTAQPKTGGASLVDACAPYFHNLASLNDLQISFRG